MHANRFFLIAFPALLLPLFAFAQPRISVDPPSFEAELFVGRFETGNFTITNEGDAALNWQVQIDVVMAPDGGIGRDWLTLDQFGGEVAAGQGQVIECRVGGGRLPSGEYMAEIHFLTNDPENADYVVTVVAMVNDAPDLDVNWLDQAGYPDLIDFNLLNEQVLADTDYSTTFTITNQGTEDLYVERMIIGGNEFSLEEDVNMEFILAPTEFRDFHLHFLAADTGDYRSTLTITSNDPIEGEFFLPLHANTTLSPEMDVSQDTLLFEVGDQPVTHQFQISNFGQAPLIWSASCILIEGDRRDTSAIRVTVDPIEGEVAPGSFEAIGVSVECLDDRSLEMHYLLRIVSNDPLLEEYFVDVFITRTSDVLDESVMTLPADHILSGCYPNPFNASTTLILNVPIRSEVVVKVFDALGREQGELFRGSKEAGIHQLSLEAGDFPAGTYLIQAEVGGRMEQVEVQLVR